MPLRLFLLLILFIISSSFFWEDEQKVLRQLNQKGETAFQLKDFEQAKEAFKELLIKVSPLASHKNRVDWHTYTDLALRLAECHEGLGEPAEGEKVLIQLLQKHPPDPYLIKIYLLKMRLCPTLEAQGEALVAIRQLAERIPLENWSKKDLTFLHALESSLNTHYDALMEKGKCLLVGRCYPEAIAVFEEVLQGAAKGAFPKAANPDSLILKKVRYRLAECYFLQADYAKTLSFYQKGEVSDALDKEMLYLAALCYQERRDYEKAVELFQCYAHAGNRDEVQHYDHALFELGLFHFQNKNYEKAKSYLQKLTPSCQKPNLLGALYLARIHLAEENALKAEHLLSKIEKHLSLHDPLRFEWYYLKGRANYELKKYGEAIHFFEKSLSDTHASWKEQARYHLGWSYLKFADSGGDPVLDAKGFLNKAEECFTELIKTDLFEPAALSLCQLYYASSLYYPGSDSGQKLKNWVEKCKALLSTEGNLQALLILAECSSPSDKESLYSEAVDTKYSSAPGYYKAWCHRALHHFKEGVAAQSPPLLEMAIQEFREAFRGAEKKNRAAAARILKWEAQACWRNQAPADALQALERVLKEFSESLPEREETLFLQGFLASQFEEPPYRTLAEEALNTLIEKYPEGHFRADALYALGTLCYKKGAYDDAEKHFLEIGSQHPKSTYAPEAWFWAAEAACQAGRDGSGYRRIAFERYPQSDIAADSYFSFYPYALYLEKNQEAINHLKGLPSLFPHSPLVVAAHFLVALSENTFEKGKASFESALRAFDTYYLSQERVLDPTLIRLRYQTLLKLADLYLDKGEGEEGMKRCAHLLKTIVSEFSQKNHPFVSALNSPSPYPPIFEEAEFKLALCYLKEGLHFAAQKLLSQMLSHYESAGIEEGYFLSLVWQQQGELALTCQDYATARRCLELAGQCGRRFLSEEQKLSQWLLLSDAFRGTGEYDVAMRLLSKVINAETASPLRVKAMFLRAEIYELEGRPELAVRQLESTAKKGGIWAHQAKEKLRIKYGLE